MIFRIHTLMQYNGAQTKVQSLDLGNTCMGTNTGTISGLREHLYGHKQRYNPWTLGALVWAQTQVQSLDLGSTCMGTNTGTISGLREHLYGHKHRYNRWTKGELEW